METIYVYTDEWMFREDVVCVCVRAHAHVYMYTHVMKCYSDIKG